MEKFPRLEKMGVLHPNQIKSFSISSIEYIDTLRIDYERPKGSFLPVTRSYKFPRIQKDAVIGGNTSETKIVMESNPALREALAELRSITEVREKTQHIAGEILAELNALEQDVDKRIEWLKCMVGKIKPE